MSDATLHTTAIPRAGNSASVKGIRWTFGLLLLFHLVLVGMRLRFGAFPLEFFFLVTLLTFVPLLHYIAKGRPLDHLMILVLLMIAVRAFSLGYDIIRFGDHLEERVYFAVHRMIPLFAFLWLYAWRREILQADGLRLIATCVAAAVLLHASATIAAALSEPALAAVGALARLMDATSARSHGIVNSLYAVEGTGGYVTRAAGLLKGAPMNAGFLGTIGSVCLFLFYFHRKSIFLALAALALAACVLTFGRGGLATIFLGLILTLAVLVMSGSYRSAWRLVLLVSAVAMVVYMILASVQSGANLEIAIDRFSQFFNTARFESAQLKLKATERFFEIFFADYKGLFYPGQGLNNLILHTRGKQAFDSYELGFTSNSWLIFAYDCGIVYLTLTLAAVLVLIRRSLRTCPGLLIILLPLSFAAASDNYFALNFEMHALFWVLLGLTTIYQQAAQRTARAGTSAGHRKPVMQRGALT